MSTPTDPKPYEALDIPIEPPDEQDREYEELPTGAYLASLIGFRQVEKSAMAIQWDLQRRPDKDPDRLQWEWSFEINDGEWKGARISKWTSRSWHSKSTAASIACALFGVTMLPRDGGWSTGKLVGRSCQLFVVEGKPKDDGTIGRSKIDSVRALPKRRQNTAPAPVQEQQMAGASEDGYWQSVHAQDPGPEAEEL